VRSVAEADSLLSTASSPQRDKSVADWARGASADDLAWLLRRSPAELGTAERIVLDAALAVTPPKRAVLRQRWLARIALSAPRLIKKGDGPVLDLTALRPFASVFRLAVLLPDQGDYASYSRPVRVGLRAGLDWERAGGALPIEFDTLGTGDSDPARVAAAFAHSSTYSEVVVGELLSVPTLSLATAATVAGLTLVSPTATDERIGRVGPGVFQASPGVQARARALAAVVLGREAHPVAITGSATGVNGAFALAFTAEVESRGGSIVRREPARSGAADLTALARSLIASGADVLFWDGPTRDAEALVRALATAGATLRLCGGPALAPDLVRAASRPLFEEVTYADDDWRLPATARVRLDSLATELGLHYGSLMTRGFLVGRRIAAAIDGGARTADEVAARLRHHDPARAAGGFLEVERDGATLPVFVIRRGKAVLVTADQ
jgi:ABC-type branched-subunit amino acid transport system substrate-binding protein